jgi:hypothetical protein
MNWTDQIISDFGTQIGLPGLRLDQKRHVRLDSDDGYGIALIDSADLPIPEFIVVLARPNNYLKAFQLEQILTRCHHTSPTPWPLQLACSPSESKLAVRIPHRSLSLSSLNQAISVLKKLHDEML